MTRSLCTNVLAVPYRPSLGAAIAQATGPTGPPRNERNDPAILIIVSHPLRITHSPTASALLPLSSKPFLSFCSLTPRFFSPQVRAYYSQQHTISDFSFNCTALHSHCSSTFLVNMSVQATPNSNDGRSAQVGHVTPALPSLLTRRLTASARLTQRSHQLHQHPLAIEFRAMEEHRLVRPLAAQPSRPCGRPASSQHSELWCLSYEPQK